MNPKKTEEIETINLDEEDTNITSGFSGKKPLDQKQIIMEAWRDARMKRAKEMTRGYWKPIFDNQGREIYKTWYEDTRETFINSVIALECVLSADFDSDYIQFRKDKEKQEKDDWEQFAYKEYAKDSEGKKTQQISNMFMPEIGSIIKGIKGYWDNKVNQWIQSRLGIYTKIFAELSKLLKRLKYLGQTVQFG